MYELQYTKPSNTTSAVAEFDKSQEGKYLAGGMTLICLLYTSPSPRDRTRSRMPSSA